MDGEIEDFHRILPRLSEVPGYKWDLSIAPFHTVSYPKLLRRRVDLTLSLDI